MRNLGSELAKQSRDSNSIRQMEEVNEVQEYFVQTVGTVKPVLKNIVIRKRSSTGKGFILDNPNQNKMGSRKNDVDGQLMLSRSRQDEQYTSWSKVHEETPEKELEETAKDMLELWLRNEDVIQPSKLSWGSSTRDYDNTIIQDELATMEIRLNTVQHMDNEKFDRVEIL